MSINRASRLKLQSAQILVLGFIAIILVGAILLNLSIASKNGESVGFINALFTSTSAVCVTGLVVVDTGTYWTLFGQVVILILIQTGGLGFMTMATLIAFTFGKRITLKERIVMQEALNQFNLSGVVRLTKYILITTFSIEAIGAILLSIRFIPEMGILKGAGYSIFHSVSAFCNAGFDLMGSFNSLTAYVNDPLVSLSVAFLIVLGGLGYTVIIEVIQKRKFSRFTLHTKLVLIITATLIIIGFLVILILEMNNPETLLDLPIHGKILSSIFHAITPRTAGFNTLPTNKLTMAIAFFTIIMMFIGGSPAGTAGGVKTTTAGVLALSIISLLKGKEETHLFSKRISSELVKRSMAIIGISAVLVVLVTMILSITEQGHSFLEIFFEAVSAFGTVGLSLGITTELTWIGKLIITFTMFAGRVGPLTLVLALVTRLQSNNSGIRYPEEKVIVG